jgi:hypothetical protein
MKKTILTLLLAAMSTCAMAEWVKVGGNDEATIYIDPATIKKDGNLSRIWRLHELKQRATNGEMSMRSLMEYDCERERFRLLSRSTHSEPIAGGKMLFSNDQVGEWAYIPPETIGATILKIVCSK